jgi:hypothetical protein
MHYEGHMGDKLESAGTKDANFDIEREKLALERMRLEIEREKLTVGRQKIKWIALAIVIPLLVFGSAVWVWRVQQYLETRDGDALTAAEIIKSARHDEPRNAGVADKKELLGLLAAHPDRHVEIVAYWQALFPNDDWVVPLQQVVQERARTRKAASVAKAKPSAAASEPIARYPREAPPNVQNFGGEALGIELPQPGGGPAPLPSGGPDETPVFR